VADEAIKRGISYGREDIALRPIKLGMFFRLCEKEDLYIK
jgi:hypothetical protein